MVTFAKPLPTGETSLAQLSFMIFKRIKSCHRGRFMQHICGWMPLQRHMWPAVRCSGFMCGTVCGDCLGPRLHTDHDQTDARVMQHRHCCTSACTAVPY